MEKTYKRFFMSAVAGIIGSMVIIAAIVVIVDPFYSYHLPFFGWKAQNWDETYCNPGLIRHSDYDGALVGTSMTEQFRASEAGQILGGTYIKTKRSAGTSMDMKKIIELLQDANPKIQNIVLGLDVNMLRNNSKGYRSELPEYLYDTNYLNDVSYWYNEDVLFKYTYELYSLNKSGRIQDLDDAFIYDMNRYGKEITLQDYTRPKIKDASAKAEGWLALGRENLNNLIPTFMKNQNIHYDVFIPPYSILYWEQMIRTNRLDEEYALQKDALKILLECPNVTVHYLMDCKEIVTDLENYKDVAHYSPMICNELLLYMKSGEKQITPENYVQILDSWFEYVKNYDYDQYFSEE